jgi:hypothetical protein
MGVARALGLGEQGCIDLSVAISTSTFSVSVALCLLLFGIVGAYVMMHVLVHTGRIKRSISTFALPSVLIFGLVLAMLFSVLTYPSLCLLPM